MQRGEEGEEGEEDLRRDRKTVKSARLYIGAWTVDS
jgi:hypothetical protein